MPARLWRGVCPRVPLLAVCALGMLASGCSYPLGSMFGKNDDKASKTEVTGTVAQKVEASAQPSAFADEDLLAASTAAASVLALDTKDSSAPWHNPSTGARGTVTPIAASYMQDGFTCRDFLASYVREAEEGWWQGEACRVHHGKWVVRSLKPWKKA
jgi:surface antigen